MSDIEREAFEKEFPVPKNVEWCGNGYAPTKYSADQGYNRMWKVWQAAREASASGEVEPLGYLMTHPRKPPMAVTASSSHPEAREADAILGWSYTPLYAHPPAKVPEVPTEEMLDEGVTALIRGLKTFKSNYTQVVNNIWEDMAAALLTTPTPATTPETEWVKPTGRKHHDLKTDPSVFRQSLNGVKAWEIRRDDRDFVRGDTVTLHETENTGEEIAEGAPLVYTGRKITGVIGFVLNGPAYGLKPDWSVFSLLPTPPQEQ